VSGLMEVLGDISTLISVGEEVEGIFGGATPPLSDIEAELATEVAAVFFGAQLQQQVIDAASQLQSAQQFFAVNYLNAQNFHQTPAQLSTLLNSSESPGLNNLSTVALTVDGWLSAAVDQPAPKDLISTAMSVCLGVYLHMCLLYRERAANASPSDVALTEAANKESYARQAVQTMQSRVMNRIANRIACLGYSEGIWNPPSGDPTYAYAVPLSQAAISDSWFDGGSNSLLSSLPLQYPGGWNPSTVVQRVWHAYRRLLWSGADADYNELLAALNDQGMGTIIGYRVTNVDHSMRDAFIANSLPGVRAFGKWAASARGVLMSLDAMGMRSPGYPRMTGIGARNAEVSTSTPVSRTARNVVPRAAVSTPAPMAETT